MKLDESKLSAGCVIGVTTRLNPLSAIIKARTAGVKNAFSMGIASHIVCVAESHGLLYGIEMKSPRIRRVDLNDLDPIVFIARPCTTIYEQEQANNFLWKCHSLHIKYDNIELLKFLNDRIPNDPKKWICSDLSREMLRHVGVTYPQKWDRLTSPYDQQQWFAWGGFTL
jgi:hypothetical protein